MEVKYKVVSTYKPGQGRNGEKLWFPKLTGASQVDQYDIAEIMEKRTTASGPDLLVILTGLVELIPELLLSGKTIKLNRLGTFRLHAKVEPASAPEEVTVKNIKELRISFRPDNVIKRKLKNCHITKAK